MRPWPWSTAPTSGFATFGKTAGVVAAAGVPAGLLWWWISPDVPFQVLRGRAYLADPESETPIGVDARFALIALVAGVVCGIAAYRAGGRGNDVPLVLGLAVGGAAASLIAWRLGHQIGQGAFEDAVAAGPDMRTVSGPPDLRARGLLVFWPLMSVGMYGALELVVKRLPARDGRDQRAGEDDEVGGGQLDLEAAPTGRDVDGRQG